MIRAYQPDDLFAVQEVWYQASLVAHPFLEDDFLMLERKRIADVYMPLAETWVYVLNEEVIGFLSLIEHEVGAIFVHPDQQNKGMGRALMDHACTQSATLELDVFKANAIGRRFYERYGFMPLKEHIHEETGNLLIRLRLECESSTG